MTEDLMDIAELKKVLGYRDERSVKNWCKRNSVPIIKVGVRKYIQSQYLRFYIDNQLVTFDTETRTETKPNKKLITGYYKSNNEIVAKYLSKYESDTKT